VAVASGNETILVVDDDAEILNITRQMLSGAGYRVTTALSASQALALVSDMDVPADLLMTDFVMPDMNGVELVQRVRSLRPALPILYFSAYSGHEPLRPEFARGVPYLAKPFTVGELRRRVREILDGRSGAAANA
jgi:two-component system cell cycle sensor histidine kinase/response regulator CckA